MKETNETHTIDETQEWWYQPDPDYVRVPLTVYRGEYDGWAYHLTEEEGGSCSFDDHESARAHVAALKAQFPERSYFVFDPMSFDHLAFGRV